MTTYPERGPLDNFLIMNFLEITDLIGEQRDRILLIFKRIRKELDAGNIQNNMIAAPDDDETHWLFSIYKKEGDFYYLEFQNVAK
ncbi:MAG: hypothetical protein E6Q36_05620 [Chryseobacterium sp.]|nr:MAG: hypothetical protein E6Q36_05620 [Chryseobacterium sp.]